jgi:hypothetical protein
MHGIVSFLDEPHYRRVEELWAELSGRFDVEGIYVTPYPHFSYQVAESYDREKVASILQRLAGRTGPVSGSHQRPGHIHRTAAHSVRAGGPQPLSGQTPGRAVDGRQPGRRRRGRLLSTGTVAASYHPGLWRHHPRQAAGHRRLAEPAVAKLDHPGEQLQLHL